MTYMKCSLCGIMFDPDKANPTCAGCFMSKGCELIRCPNCNFENTPDPKWLKEQKKKNKENKAACQ